MNIDAIYRLVLFSGGYIIGASAAYILLGLEMSRWWVVLVGAVAAVLLKPWQEL